MVFGTNAHGILSLSPEASTSRARPHPARSLHFRGRDGERGFEMKTVLMILVAMMVFAACAQEAGEDATIVADTVNPVAEPFDTRPDVALTEAGATAVVVLGDGTIGFPTEAIGPGPVVFTIQNSGTLLHSLSIQGSGENAVSAVLQDPVDAGEESSLQIDLVPGSYVAWCALHPDEPGERVEFTVEAP